MVSTESLKRLHFNTYVHNSIPKYVATVMLKVYLYGKIYRYLTKIIKAIPIIKINYIVGEA